MPVIPRVLPDVVWEPRLQLIGLLRFLFFCQSLRYWYDLDGACISAMLTNMQVDERSHRCHQIVAFAPDALRTRLQHQHPTDRTVRLHKLFYLKQQNVAASFQLGDHLVSFYFSSIGHISKPLFHPLDADLSQVGQGLTQTGYL
ncbi:hypothetical protein EAI_07770 [Harpegnathos saltator]|uniref:Uncharacterized protein n=1 Tax=Harpegnathos saltator TaxID=610380 RepID=E2BB51_HARSA|nr:hypothetical protein EAI_07770 [Harpegnathos saltator]